MENRETNHQIGDVEYAAPYPVRAFLDVSTLYLTAKTRQWMHSIMFRDPTDRPLLGGPMPYGWFVWAPESLDAYKAADGREIPDDLQRVLIYARERNCEYVLFDADAAPDAHPDLPSYPDSEELVATVQRRWRVTVRADSTDRLEASVIVEAPGLQDAEDKAWDFFDNAKWVANADWKPIAIGIPENFQVHETIEVSELEGLLDRGEQPD